MDELQAQKLEKFSDSVNTEAGEHINKIMSEAKEQSSIAIDKAVDDALYDAYNKIQKAVRDIEARYRRQYALKEQEFRMNSLRYRDELSTRIFSDVEKKLTEFTLSEKYCDYLMKIADDEELSENTVIALSPKDEKYGSRLEKKYGFEVKTDDSIEIGGAMLIDSDKGLIIDKTFDGALVEQKKSFSSRYSFKA